MADNNQHVEDIVKCPECGSRSLTRDETRGEVVCDDCGLVLEDNVIDQGAEWRVFSLVVVQESCLNHQPH